MNKCKSQRGCSLNGKLVNHSFSVPTITYVQLTPVVDGDFIPNQPGQLFHNAADIDYLAGINDMDGYSFTSQDIPTLADKNSPIPVYSQFKQS